MKRTGMGCLAWAATAVMFAGGCDPAMLSDMGAAVNSGVASATPETILLQFEAARKSEDWKTYAACLTTETHDAAARAYVEEGLLLHSGRELSKLAGRQAVQQYDAETKELRTVLARHGLTLEKLAPLENISNSTPEYAEKVRELVASIPDRQALMVDMLPIVNKRPEGTVVEEAESTIDSIVINGNEATATVTARSPSLQAPFTATVKLRLTERGWRIDHSELMQ